MSTKRNAHGTYEGRTRGMSVVCQQLFRAQLYRASDLLASLINTNRCYTTSCSLAHVYAYAHVQRPQSFLLINRDASLSKNEVNCFKVSFL